MDNVLAIGVEVGEIRKSLNIGFEFDDNSLTRLGCKFFKRVVDAESV